MELALICFVDGGSTDVSQLAARLVSEGGQRNAGRIGYLSCHRNAEQTPPASVHGIAETLIPGRELIEAIRVSQRSHQHVAVDVGGAPDQTVALAVALSDVVITPLCLDGQDHAAFIHAVDLVQIVSANMRRSLRHAVFLATRSETATAATLLQVSGLLAMKGLATLPVPLCAWDSDAAIEAQAHAAFAPGVLALLDQPIAPAVHERRFG